MRKGKDGIDYFLWGDDLENTDVIKGVHLDKALLYKLIQHQFLNGAFDPRSKKWGTSELALEMLMEMRRMVLNLEIAKSKSSQDEAFEAIDKLSENLKNLLIEYEFLL